MAYLTFEILSNGVINWCCNNYSTILNTIEYRKNGGEWTSITASMAGAEISVVSGDVLEFRGDNATYSGSVARYGMFGDGKTTAQFKAKGNIMSLINSTDFENLKSFTSNYTFRALFNNCNTLMDISELVLPATSLTTGSYRFMFQACTNITTSPVLPATTLTNECYQGMFAGCSSLNKIECLATSITATDCTGNWVSGVSSTGLFIKSPDISESTWGRGNSKIPTNWIVEDKTTLSITPDHADFIYTGGTTTASTESETSWTATTTDNWFSFVPTTGESGTTNITITVPKNDFNARTGNITFTDAEDNTVEFNITQGGIDGLVPNKKLYKGNRRLN